MYVEEYKKERIKDQLKTLGFVGLDFRNIAGKLVEILNTQEDIYGYLVGYSKHSGRWEYLIVTDSFIYFLDKTTMFKTGYKQFSVKKLEKLVPEKNMLRKYKVTLFFGRHDIYVFDDCYSGLIEEFRSAVYSAQNGLGLPYTFDKTNYEKKKKSEETQTYSEHTYYEEDVKKGYSFVKSYDPSDRDGKENFLRNVKNSKYAFNHYLYPLKYGEGFVKNNYNTWIFDSEKQEAYEHFKFLTGLEPEPDDYYFLENNRLDTVYFLEKGLGREYILAGRKKDSSLTNLKTAHGRELTKIDFSTKEEYIKYLIETRRMLDPKKPKIFIGNPSIYRTADGDMDYETLQEHIDSKSENADNYFETIEDVPKHLLGIPEEDEDESNEDSTDTSDKGFITFFEEIQGTDLEDDVYLDIFGDDTDTNGSDDADFLSQGNETLAPLSDLSDTYKMLVEYKSLLDLGILTQAEFDHKKKELLNLP